MHKTCDVKQQIGGANKKGAKLIDSIDVSKPKINTLDKALQGILESQNTKTETGLKLEGVWDV